MRKLLTFAFLTLAGTASAEPITLGSWSQMPAASNSGSPFYANKSWDCDACGLGFRMSGMEYLHAADDPNKSAAFYWENWAGGATDLGGQSAYLNDHKFGYDPLTGEFSLDNGHGWTSRSGALDNVVLLRFVEPALTTYMMWFEDLPLGHRDGDYQDRGFLWRVANATTAPPPPVPEPGTMVLVGTGLLFAARRLRQGRRNGSGQRDAESGS